MVLTLFWAEQDAQCHAEEGHAHAHGVEEEAGETNINLRGAIVHVIGDLVQSLGVALAGALIWWKQVRACIMHACMHCAFMHAFKHVFELQV